MTRLVPIAVIAVLAGSAFAASAEAPAKGAQPGRALALKICTPCHVVSPDQQFAPVYSGPPDFHAIANKPDTSAKSLRRFILNTHSSIANPKNMPNPQLTSDQARDIANYIMTLKDHP